MRLLFLVALASWLSTQIAHGQDSPPFAAQRGSFGDSVVTVQWTFSDAYDSISFDLTVHGHAWVAVGISASDALPRMVGSDFLVCLTNSTGFFVVDAAADPNSSSGHAAPVEDVKLPGGSSDVYGVSAESADGATTYHFSRKCYTGDPFDVPCVLAKGFFYSYGSLNADGTYIARHGSRAYLQLLVPMFNWSRHVYINNNTGDANTTSIMWALSEDLSTITFVARTTSNWVGAGFSKAGNMSGSDFIVASFDPSDSTFAVTDRTAAPVNESNWRGEPIVDTSLGGTNDILASAVFWHSGQLIFQFSRKVVTGDVFDQAIANATLALLLAHGPTDGSGDLLIHTETLSRSLNFFVPGEFDFLPLPTTPVIPFVPVARSYLIEVHAILMVVAWTLIAFPLGAMARYFKIILPSWFYIHRAGNIFVALASIVALILAFEELDWTLYLTAHAGLGIATISIMALQVLLGFTSHWMWHPGKLPAFFPDKIHWWTGRIVVLMAVTTIFLGIDLYQELYGDVEDIVPMVLMGVYVAVTLVVVVWLETTIGQKVEIVPEGYNALLDVNGGDSEPFVKEKHTNPSIWYGVTFYLIVSVGLILSVLIDMFIGIMQV